MRYSRVMAITTPWAVAQDPSLRARFQDEVAYRDGRVRDSVVRGYDASVLGSPSGLVVVAWLWPDQSFASDIDPFDLAATVSPQEWRIRLGAQFEHALWSAARAVESHGHSDAVDDVLSYLMWQADLSEGDVVRLQAGTVDQLAVWVRICRWLHLEFVDGWRIADPARLGERIEHARLARRIADDLKHLPTGQLRSMRRNLSPLLPDPVPRMPQETYRAPKGRYRGLYLALAQDSRQSPTYTIDEINRILESHGEGALPPSATEWPPNWWSGRGTKTEGRPQVAAWWAAGYRIAEEFNGLSVYRDRLGETEILFDRPPTEEEAMRESVITGVRFQSLPGREEWLTNQDRVESGEYRLPESVSVPLAGLSATPLLSDHTNAPLLAPQRPVDVIDWVPDGDNATDEVGEPGVLVTEASLIALVQCLNQAGEMDREQIARCLTAVDTSPVGDDTTAQGCAQDGSRAIKSLLTKARRRGLIVNRGTNRKPRWVTAGSTADHVLRIKQVLDERQLTGGHPAIEALRVGPGDSIPQDFLAQVAACVGVAAPADASDVEVASAIIDWAGAQWRTELYVSNDGSLTREGLKVIADAVQGTVG